VRKIREKIEWFFLLEVPFEERYHSPTKEPVEEKRSHTKTLIV